jgi:glycolate oxidase iron-sulfur subunit
MNDDALKMTTPSKIKILISSLKHLEATLNRCTRCGMCMAACPLYKTTGRETDTARGKIALLSGIIHGILTNGQGVSQRTGRCLLCGSCALKCPREIRPHELLIQARAFLTEYHGLSLFEKILFRRFLSHPSRFDAISSLGEKGLHFFLNRSGQGSIRELPAIFSGRCFKPLAPKPFHEWIKEGACQTPPGDQREKPLKVAFFTGCLIDKIYPEIGMAAYRVLSHADINVETPLHQGCCGMPALTAGDLLSFTKLVQHHLKIFSSQEYDAIVSACPTCVVAIKHLWPMMMENASPSVKESIRIVSGKTMDIHQLAYELYKKTPFSEPIPDATPVTYHAPCHLKKSLGVDREPLFLIQMNPMNRLIAPDDADACCGFGGTFHLKHHGVSMQIGMRKRESILKTGAKKVVTGCPACMLQLEELFHKNKDHISVVHTMEAVSENLSKG